MSDDVAPISEWRRSREPGWTKDIGYDLQRVLALHSYRSDRKGAKPRDPGWHECSCGWEGYWVSFHPHVADHLRSAVIPTPTEVLPNRAPYDKCSAHLYVEAGKEQEVEHG